ncbi:VOC family protein [Streptomyces cacaoi]|uniref:VOC family protein n=1 Tax=Streptomyces cacaoi TaxID=1898 RepID=UPI00374A7C9E
MRVSYEVFHKDVAELVRFYVAVLGFEGPEIPGASDYVVVTRGEVRVGCCRHGDADDTPRKPPAGSEIVLRVDDVEAEHARVVAAGWPLADPLMTRPWGMTDFRVFDPSGQYLRITNTRAAAGESSGAGE